VKCGAKLLNNDWVVDNGKQLGVSVGENGMENNDFCPKTY
jgi:hypothetical protein